MTRKLGLVESDIIQLIKYKKYKGKDEFGKPLVCNQLSMVDDFSFHEGWWKTNINKELYWELQYEWRHHDYFRNGVFFERMRRAVKLFKLTKITTWKTSAVTFLYHLTDWLRWNNTVVTNYQIYVKLPYLQRTSGSYSS